MLLTNLKVQKAKPQARQYKLADERGMYLLIHPKGGKYWRLDYRFEGRRKTLAIGTHPETSLKEARKKRDRARSDIEDGIDPSGHQNGKPALGGDSFEIVAREWHEKYRSQWTEGHASTTLRRLEANLLPWLGKRPLGAIEPPELLRSLRRVENRGAVETAHRVQPSTGSGYWRSNPDGQCWNNKYGC